MAEFNIPYSYYFVIEGKKKEDDTFEEVRRWNGCFGYYEDPKFHFRKLEDAKNYFKNFEYSLKKEGYIKARLVFVRIITEHHDVITVDIPQETN
jgi:hypothetical protein